MTEPPLTGSLLASEEQTSPCPISCCISTPPSSAAHGTWLPCAAVAYSAWKVCGTPVQVELFMVSAKPLCLLAVMKPVWWVVMSVIVVVKPADGSVIATLSTSPELILRVRMLGKKVWPLAFCGLGGAAGTPFFLREAELSGVGRRRVRVPEVQVGLRAS